MIPVGNNIEIPSSDLQYVASPSQGPGGQNVNKVSTRITLLFDLEGTACFSEKQKTLIRRKLSTRINRDGFLRISSQKDRTQAGNRRLAGERLGTLLQEALVVQKERHKRGTPRSQKRKRKEDKRRRGQVKSSRGRRWARDD